MRKLWFLLLLGMVAMGQSTKTFTNPLLSVGPDPYLTFFNGFYYLTYTTGSDIRIRKASSLTGFETALEQSVWSDFKAERSFNTWAPEFHRLQGPDGWHWYMYYTAGPSQCCADQRMHVLESAGDDPLGPYTYKGKLADPAHDFWAIDATVFENKGTLYVVYSGTPQDKMPYEKPQNLYIARLENPWMIAGERAEISTPTLPWETMGGAVNEGPALVKRNNKLYLAYSGSGCWTDDYAVGVLVASENADLLRPQSWLKMPKPILKRNDAAGVFAPGHNTFFKSPDGKEDWIIYHANAGAGFGCGDLRSPRAQKVTWGSDGLPQIKPVASNTPLALPSGDPGGR